MFRPCFYRPPQDKYFVKAPSPTPHFSPSIFRAFSQWEYFILCGIPIYAREINPIFLPFQIWNWNPLYWEKRVHFFIFHKKSLSNQTIKKRATRKIRIILLSTIYSFGLTNTSFTENENTYLPHSTYLQPPYF